jgi:16S rRNA C1402 (ribose-2'-O) methylase RsmI
VIPHFQDNPPRGEVTLVIEGAKEVPWGQKRVEQALRRLASEGRTGSRAVKEVAKLSRRPRAEVYDIWLGMEDQ